MGHMRLKSVDMKNGENILLKMQVNIFKANTEIWSTRYENLYTLVGFGSLAFLMTMSSFG